MPIDVDATLRALNRMTVTHPPLGYDIVQGPKLVVNAIEAQRVREIFDEYLRRQSLIRTCQWLSERGWTTKSWTTRAGQTRGGQPFDKVRLFRVLNNVAYLGKLRYKDEIHSGEHEAIVDEETFNRVQQMLRSNGRDGGSHVRNKHGALLKGLLFCKPCSRPMMHGYTSKGNRRYCYYICYTAQKQGWNACPSKSVPAEQIERFVVEQIRCIGKEPTVRALVLEALRAQQASTEVVTKAEVDATLEKFTPLWDALSPREQARVVQLLLQRVDYDGANGKVAVTFHAHGLKSLGQNCRQQEIVAGKSKPKRKEAATCPTA